MRQRSAPCQRVLRVAAVVGRDFSLSLLRRLPVLAGLDVLTLLGEALESRLIGPSSTEADGYRFGHALVRETLYADLPLTERIALHREIGEAIEAAAATALDAHIAVLAHHFREAAADGDTERAIHYGLRAGERATHALAHEEAVAHYARTLQVLERATPIDEARRCPLLIALGLAQVRVGDPIAAETTFLRAAALARDLVLPEELARAALGIGEIERQSDRVVPLLEEALAALDVADSVLRARLLSRLAVALYWAPSDTRKRALSDDAIAMARRLGYQPTLAYALSSRIAALSGPDDVEARLAASQEMVTLADQCANSEFAMIGHGWSIADSLATGDVHRARFAIARFAELAKQSRHPYFVWWLAAIRTMEAIVEGRLTEAEELAAVCFARGQRTVAVDAAHVFAGHRYAVCIEGERHDELEPVVRAVAAQFPSIPSIHAGLGLLHADRGRFDEAAAELDLLAADDFAILPRNPEWLTTVAALAQASALLPDAPHAATLFAMLAPYRGRNIVAGMGVLCPGSVAHFLGILATRLGRFEDAERCLAEALAAHERLGGVLMCAYTRYEQASLALARRAPGDETRATELAAAAMRDAEAHGMKRLQRLLAALPVPSAAAVSTRTSTRDPARDRATSPARAAVFRREGDNWRLGWNGTEFQLRDRVGLRHLAMLLAHPSRELLAVDLVRGRTGPDGNGDPATDITALTAELGRPRALANAEAKYDERAELAYRRRLHELRDVIEEARRQHDLGRIAQAESETDVLTREIARGLGLQSRGRDSRSPIERARISATRAIRIAIRLIQEHDRGLGRHLGVTIKTGTFCIYVPDPEVHVTWSL
jgi:tetratricopeptide (TPR) repeat protein